MNHTEALIFVDDCRTSTYSQRYDLAIRLLDLVHDARTEAVRNVSKMIDEAFKEHEGGTPHG